MAVWLKLQELAPGRGFLIPVDFPQQVFLVLGGLSFPRIRNGAGGRRRAQALARDRPNFFARAEPAAAPTRTNHRVIPT